MKKHPSRVSPLGVSVFFPCYNDAKSIGRLVRVALATLKKNVKDWEIIVINDGSTDESARVLAKLSGKITGLRIVTHERNMGYGAALRSGFAAAQKSLVFYTDGDGQFDPKELSLLLPLMDRDTDFVNGTKINRNDPTHRVFFGALYRVVVGKLFTLPFADVDCDFRLIRASVLDKITLVSTSGAICVELVKKSEQAGARFRCVPVHHYKRPHGTSQFFRVARIGLTLYELIGLWFRLMISK